MQAFPLNITAAALMQLQKVKKIHNQDNEVPFVRIGIKGGSGCVGATNFIALDEKSEKDNEYTFEGVNFVIEKPHLMYLVGLTIDFVQTEFEQGFVFGNG